MTVVFPNIDGFLVDALAGIGGMGAVYRATERATGAVVALKVLESRGRIGLDEGRFHREIELLRSIDHPAVVRYLGHGRTESGEPYLAMEWIEGEDLATRIAQGPFSLVDAVRVVRRVAGGLGALHARGIVHRDVKPANVMLVGGVASDAKVLDLGIARQAQWTRLTKTGTAVGTPGYMAPEQARGDYDLDARVDVFALGCVLFECLTGRPAFPGEHIVAILARILLENSPVPSESRFGVPPSLDALVLRMLAKEREDRPLDANAVEAALAAIPERDLHAPVGSRAPPSLRAVTEAEQRVVSVVVASLPQRTLSAEEDRSVEGLTRLRGGKAALLGDGSMIVSFGGEGAATDRAAHAAHVALELREALEGVSIAIATGRVLVESSTKERPLGEAIDEVKRLQDDARIMIDNTTARLLEGRFEVRDANGASELLGELALGITPRKLLGKPTPCVGRERELATLRALADECADDGVARAAVVLGPAGIGKSRLLYEFIRVAEARDEPPEIWLARGDPVGQNSAFGLIASALRHAAGLFEGEPKAVKQGKLTEFVRARAKPGHEARVTAELASLLGAPFGALPSSGMGFDPIAAGDRLRAAIEDLFAGAASVKPLVFVIEDLHWGDLASVNVLDAALRRLREAPLFVVAFARPEVLSQFPKLWAGRGATELWVGELSRRACERLVREVLGPRDKIEVDALVARAAGNAFYLEELIRAAADSARQDDVPRTVLAMVEARLAALTTDARRALRAASVFGDVFWRGGLLRALGGEQHAPEVDACLADLEARELIERRSGGRFPDEIELGFRHALVREVAYGMLTDEDRAIAHRHAARWLEDAGETDARKLSEHFERARENDRAITWLLRAAEQALEGNDFPATIATAAHIEELGARGETLGKARVLSAEALRWSGAQVEGLRHAREAMSLLPRDSLGWWSAALTAGILASRTGQDLAAFGGEILENDPGDALAGARATALARNAIGLMHAGQLAESDRMLEAIDRLMPKLAGDARARAFVVAARGQRAQAAGDPSGLTAYDEATRLLREVGDLRTACDTSIGAACAWNELGRYDRAEALLLAMLADSEAMGLTMTHMAGATNLAYAYMQEGRYDEAAPLLSAALEVLGAGGNARAEAWTRTYHARLLRLRGAFEDAEREAERAAAAGGSTAPVVAVARAELAAALLAQGRAADAIGPAREALSLLASVEEGESLVRRVAVEALLATGATEEATTLLASSARRVQERAASIADPSLRASFLDADDNRWLLERAAEHEKGPPR